MKSLIWSNGTLTRSSVTRTMPSFAPGHLLRGAKWDYRIEHAVKGDGSHVSSVFKAKVIPHGNVPNHPHWAVIKTASSEDENATKCLEREHQTYLLPGVASSPNFRRMYELVDNHTLALEWLDTTLGDVKYQPDKRTLALITVFLKSVLSSCAVLERQGYVNTDIKPANVLLSGIAGDQITAKVGDLGLVVPADHLINVQPFAMRAPEVFLGHSCTEPAQVWAVAAMLLCWIKPSILGVGDSPHFLLHEAWCMAKIKRLFPDWNIPTPDEVEGYGLKATVQAARNMSRELQELPELQTIQPLDEETEKMRIPQQLRDLIRLMLVIDPEMRPSSPSVLSSREFKALENLQYT